MTNKHISEDEREYIQTCKAAEKIQDTRAVCIKISFVYCLICKCNLSENTMVSNGTITRLLVYSCIDVLLRFWSLWSVCGFFIHEKKNYFCLFTFTAIWMVIPAYMNEVLLFTDEQNGFLSALPQIGSFTVVMLTGGLADFIIKKKYLKRVNTRKLFHGVGTLAPAICLLLMSFLNCESRYLAVFLLFIGVALK